MEHNLKLEADAKYGIVLYTDGGKDVTSVAAGWGVHGYLYPVFEDKRDKFKKDKGAFGQYGYVNGNKTAATFKSGDRLVQPGGLYKLIVNEPQSMPSEPVTPLAYFDYYGPRPGNTISQVEIEAMEESLKIILEFPQLIQAVIVADSEYVCKTLTEYIFGWVKANWTRKSGKPIEHVERWQAIWKQMNLIREKGITLRIGWTRSHVGEVGNEAADANATKGKIAVLNNLEGKRQIVQAKDYGQKKKLYSRLLEQRWWYGINNELTSSYDDFPGRHVYFFGNHGKAEEEDDLIGKYTSTAKIAILVTPNKEPVLEMLHDYLFERFYEDVGLVTLGYLEHITNTERYAQLAQEEHAALYPKGRDNCVYAPDGVPVMKELRPTFHGLRLVDNLKWHLSLLKRFVDKDKSVVVTDITDIVYVREDNGKKVTVKTADCINPPNRVVKLEVGYKCMDNVGTKKIPFKMGQDIPLRNTLNAIADETVRVYAITWQRSRNEFRYGTIVQYGEDLLLTCSLSSNLVTLVGLA